MKTQPWAKRCHFWMDTNQYRRAGIAHQKLTEHRELTPEYWGSISDDNSYGQDRISPCMAPPPNAYTHAVRVNYAATA